MSQQININDLLTPAEAADRLGIGVDTVRWYARSGRLEAVRFLGRVLFDPAEIDRYARSDRTPGPKSGKSSTA